MKDYFVNRLGRPEILNRIGDDNILVFNFLNDEKTKMEIIGKQVDELTDYLAKKYRVALRLTPAFVRVLMLHPSGFERNGARGVRNLLNKMVLNPLAEQYFAATTECQGKTFQVDYRVKLEEIGCQPFDRSQLGYKWKAE
ncbi:MAG: hypothetical protein GXY83_17410 [Rhodopirellula sp.]|nr:hypothetical protein [Rhodopirellula sp.]